MLGSDPLVSFNKRGLIPAPDETEHEFFQRAEKAPILVEQALYSHPALHLFDIAPDWIEVTYSNKGLHFWEGACTWIEGKNVSIQLRKVFLKKERYLGYARDEVVAHELVHLVRGQFEEPVFEEILAYQTSSSWLRRFFGPFARSSKEAFFLIGGIALSWLSLFTGYAQQIALGGLFLLVMGGSWRLLRAQRAFTRARKKIESLVGEKRALAVLLRLTDREIWRFSKLDPQAIVDYAEKMGKFQLRWKQLLQAYF